MIRTSGEGSLFSIWRDADLLDALVVPELLTTARYEPIGRFGQGSGHVDLLFENTARSCVVAGVRLDPRHLIVREQSPIIWPSLIAARVVEERLLHVEAVLIPWLRALARAKSMAQEDIRRFRTSSTFDRARAAGFLGAAPLERVLPRMAPFVFARRFADCAAIHFDTDDGDLGAALLADLANSIDFVAQPMTAERELAQAWYGTHSRSAAQEPSAELSIVGRATASFTGLVVETSPEANSSGLIIEVPAPVPWDLLFSFDPADAPVVERFAVHAVEAPLRAAPTLAMPRVQGGSTGSILLALRSEAVAMNGADVAEALCLRDCLTNEGLTAEIVTSIADKRIEAAELIHIFGSALDAHTTSFAQLAKKRGVDFVIDLPPQSHHQQGRLEALLTLAVRSSTDDRDLATYLSAYGQRRLSSPNIHEMAPEQIAQAEQTFRELAESATAIFTSEQDLSSLRAKLGLRASDQIMSRSTFLAPEPTAAPIGHLVPSGPFALLATPIGSHSNALAAIIASERAGIPLVIAGNVYDVEYLQTLRTIAAQTIILTEPSAGVVSALHRRAHLWIDASPRPQSVAGLMRAVACGMLPAIAAESPLSRLAGPDAATFVLTSIDDAAGALMRAMFTDDRALRIAGLQQHFREQLNVALAFSQVVQAYARVATTV